MKRILLFFPLLSGCFIISHVGIGVISPNPNSSLEKPSTNSEVLLPEILLSPTSISAPLTDHGSKTVCYNVVLSKNQNLTAMASSRVGDATTK